MGERFVVALSHGTMIVELFAPVGIDPQTPHRQDELYFIHSGRADFLLRGKRIPCAAGDVLFVPAGEEHHFENMADGFATWVVFWGPEGGE